MVELPSASTMVIPERVRQRALRGQLPCLASRQSDGEQSLRLRVGRDGHAIHQLRTIERLTSAIE